MAQRAEALRGDPEAKASEMEHAIRKHCTVHFDEDPAFYKRLSEKLEKLIQEHQNNWKALAEGYEQLRAEALAGRTEAIEGLTKEATTFYDYVTQLAFDQRRCAIPRTGNAEGADAAHRGDTCKSTIGIIDFWKKPIEVKKLRGNIDTEILLAEHPAAHRAARTNRGRDRKAGGEAPRGTDEMKAARDPGISYGVVRSRRTTADIVVERDGRVIVRAPSRAS